GRVDGIVDGAHRAVAKQHVEVADMDAAEPIGVTQPLRVLEGRVVRRTAVVVVEAGIHRLVVGLAGTGGVMVRVEVLFTDRIGVAGAAGNVRNADLAPHEENPGILGGVGPFRIVGVVTFGEAIGPGPFVRLLPAGVGGVIRFRRHARGVGVVVYLRRGIQAHGAAAGAVEDGQGGLDDLGEGLFLLARAGADTLFAELLL